MNNFVASVIKIYSVVNLIGCIILTLIVSNSMGGLYAFVFFCIGLVVNFGMYAFGEIISLLQDIKDNTNKVRINEEQSYATDELPSI